MGFEPDNNTSVGSLKVKSLANVNLPNNFGVTNEIHFGFTRVNVESVIKSSRDISTNVLVDISYGKARVRIGKTMVYLCANEGL